MTTTPTSSATAGLNLAILAGRLSRPALVRTLPSGDTVLELQVTTAAPDRAQSTPVSWPGPPAAARSWPAGTEVVVLGRVRRRFFRVGGTTASRTEVVADKVVRRGRRPAVAKIVAAATASIEGARL